MKAAALALLLAALPALGETLKLSVNESLSIQMMGASAAWAVDASIVDVAAANGTVTLFGRAAGRTRIMVVSVTGQNSLEVVVAPRPRTTAPAEQLQPARGTAEVRYSSAAREIQNSVTLTREDKNRRTEAAVRTVHSAAPAGGRAQTSVATAYYRLFTRGRELTLFDRDVDHSPLTLSRTPIRGVHYLDDRWRLHAGFTAFTTYQSFFIPLERQFVAGGGYAFRTGPRSTLTPGAFHYRGEGTVLSLLYDYRDADRLFVRTELGYSNGLGAAAEVAFASKADRVRAEVRYRGDEFAVAGAGSPRGLLSDISWTHSYGRGSSASFVASATDVADTSVVAASADVDHRLTDRVSLLGGASWGSFDGAHNLTIPVGARVDFARGGLTALYRFARSATNHGGHGFRLSGRASLGRLYLSAFADRQQNAPTLDVVFAERPDLALALDELGIVATTPADIARALRENAALIELGFIDGVTVDLAPLRTQAGLELSLLGTTRSRQQLRARLLHSVVETVATRSATTVATLTYARRLTASTDLFASYSYWRTESRDGATRVQPFAEVGVRQRFDRLPDAIAGTGTISGVVFADEDLDGRSDGSGIDAVVELDGQRIERTAPDGSFVFRGIARGEHRLVAQVPSKPEAYFTTPSRVEVSTGEQVSFGVATTAARANGRVTSDAGAGIGGVRVLLARGAQQNVATSASDGTFSFNTAPGEWQLSILTDSVPPGYSMAGVEARPVTLTRSKPLDVAFALRAHRVLSGTGATPRAEITIQPLGKTVRADEAGKFLVRSLPAGQITVVSRGIEHRLAIPSAPGTIELDLGEAAAPTATGDWVVLIGAFRVAGNARQAVTLASHAGVEASLIPKGALTIVRAGPFATHAEAADAARRLKKAGLEAVIAASGK